MKGTTSLSRTVLLIPMMFNFLQVLDTLLSTRKRSPRNWHLYSALKKTFLSDYILSLKISNILIYSINVKIKNNYKTENGYNSKASF